jgi:hypothetical protein
MAGNSGGWGFCAVNIDLSFVVDTQNIRKIGNLQRIARIFPAGHRERLSDGKFDRYDGNAAW